MRPNFKKLAKNYEDLGVKALRAFVGKNSVYDETTVSKEAPYGAGVKSALDYLASLGKEYGFKVYAADLWSDPEENRRLVMDCVEYIKSHPKWHLSLQTHKLAGFK